MIEYAFTAQALTLNNMGMLVKPQLTYLSGKCIPLESPLGIDSIIKFSGRWWLMDLAFNKYFFINILEKAGYRYSDRKAEKCYNITVNGEGETYAIRAWHKLYRKTTLYTEIRDIKHLYPAVQSESNIADLLADLRKRGYNRNTFTKNALYEYKCSIGGEKRFKSLFPLLTYDEYNDMLSAYMGGYNYMNPHFKNQVIPAVSYDLISAYANIMLTENLPCGSPLKYSGAPPSDKLFIHTFRASGCLISPETLPFIKLKGTTQYLTHFNDTEFTLSTPDYELFLRVYKLFNIDHIGGYAFNSRRGMFDVFITKYQNIKSISPKGSINYETAKKMCNQLYGIFGARVTQITKSSKYSNDTISWHTVNRTPSDGVYLPISIFISAYCRSKIYSYANIYPQHFLFAATDSIKVIPIISKQGNIIDIFEGDKYIKLEWHGKCKYLKPNTYAYKPTNERIHIVASGIPRKNTDVIKSFDDFESGKKIEIAAYRQIKGGAEYIKKTITI